MSIIQKFFTSLPFLLRKIQKPANVINEVSPNLYQNLRDSSKQFIKGVLNKDQQFIRQVTSRSLGERLVQDLQHYKQQDLVQAFQLQKYHFDSAEAFYISPYVIFGEDFRPRIQSDKLWQDIRPVTSNRFIKVNPNLKFMERFKQYQKKQIYGFNCFYEPLLVDVSESERKMFGRPFMVTFQTDSANIDPYIVDCQGALFEDWRATNFR